ncbi:MAG TPA: RIO1 family regulatory kinase/ATPase [Actinomycetota bacterium]|nr:RIO1 family regulatory kinase/ATPase [Actinomycetota bacterium]
MSESEAFDYFFGEGYVTEIVRPLSSGKEASVFLCRATATAGGGLLAMKVYRPRDHRSFKNDQAYKAGRVILNGHDRRAVAKKSRYGREFEEGWWTSREWEVLGALHRVGADVPRPVAAADGAIQMGYVGGEEASAPQLRHVSLGPGEAREVFDRLMWNVELALRHNLIHADLSSFNILWWEGRATIIDLPQAVDPRSNPNASDLLARDVENVCRHFERYGLRRDPHAITRGLWTGFLFADL